MIGIQMIVDGILTGYIEENAGGKDTLLILHGWRQSSAHWQNTISLLPKDVRALALDMPTFGTTKPLPGKPNVAEYADFVHKFIQKQKLKAVTVLGHSFGGQVAVDLALRYPNDVKKLILVSSACIRNPKPNLRSKIARLIKPITLKMPDYFQKAFIRLMASSDYTKSDPEQRDVLKRILRVDYTDQLKNIKQQSFVVWGTNDKTIPNSSKLISELIPKSVLIPLYGADHNPHLTSLDKLIVALKRCLDY